MKIINKILAILIILMLGFFNFPIYAHASDSDIVISEIGAYETSDYEWLEIYNKGAEPVDLTDWKFYEDNTNHKLNAFQNDLIIEPAEYAIIADVAENFKQRYPEFVGTIIDSSWSTLREDGEVIALKNANGDIIESFTYLPCPTTSLQRINLNLNDYSETNWQVHATSNSAGKKNEFEIFNPPNDNSPLPEEPPPDEPLQPPTHESPPLINPPLNLTKTLKIVSSGTLVINEFVSDPADGEVEWIELYNKNIFDIDLSGWKIIDGSGGETILSGIIGSNFDNKFFVIENPKGKLNNSGDIIILKDPHNNIINTVSYGNWDNGFVEQNAPVAKDPFSTARIFDGTETFNNKNDFVVTQTPTKGEPNFITLNEEKEKEVKPLSADGSTVITMPAEGKITISEIYPNPIGADTEGEWLELKNIGNAEIDLAGWQIKDNGKKIFKISSKKFTNTIIKPGDFFIIERKISGLALNNDKETIKLISPENKTIQIVKYSEDENVPENTSYIQDEIGDWFWTTTPTKGKGNILTKLNHAPEINLDCPKQALLEEIITCDASDSYDLEDDNLTFTWQVENQTFFGPILDYQFKQVGNQEIILLVGDKQLETTETQKIKIADPKAKTVSKRNTKISNVKSAMKKTLAAKTKISSAQKIITAELKEIRKLAKDTKVKTTGVVSVMPNTFGKTIMYVAGSGIQLYMSKANWPKLQIGDLIEINGTLSEAFGETRIKLANASAIKILATQPPPEPKEIKISEIGEDVEGYLVKISGQLIEKTGSNFYLQDETGEALVYIKQNTKINKAQYLEGDQLNITGIVSQNNEKYQVLPRSTNDIQKNVAVAPIEKTTIPENNLGNDILKYLIATAFFWVIGLVILFNRLKKKT